MKFASREREKLSSLANNPTPDSFPFHQLFMCAFQMSELAGHTGQSVNPMRYS